MSNQRKKKHIIIIIEYISYVLTYSMVQSPSWAANWFAAIQEIPRISRSPKVHYRTHKLPLRIILSPEQASRMWVFLNNCFLQGGVRLGGLVQKRGPQYGGERNSNPRRWYIGALRVTYGKWRYSRRHRALCLEVVMEWMKGMVIGY